MIRSSRSQIAATLVFLAGMVCTYMAASGETIDISGIQGLPLLDNGRVKPLDTFARETVRVITGSQRFGVVEDQGNGIQDISARMDALPLLLDWVARPSDWSRRPLLQVPLLELRAKLHLPAAQKWISPVALRDNNEFGQWVSGLLAKSMSASQSQEEVEFTRLEQAAIDLQERLKLFNAVCNQTAFRVLPVDGQSDQWISLGEMDSMKGSDQQVVQPILQSWNQFMQAYASGDSAASAASAQQLQQSIRSVAGEDYANAAKLNREVWYNTLQPFRIVWIAYLLSLIVMVASGMMGGSRAYAAGVAVYACAIAFNGFAFWARCSITGWAPVTNMYETVIWVAMVGAVIALVLELIYRRRTLAIAGSTVAVFAALVADVMPPELGNSIRNLAPVLRSNMWLSIHVLTIVSSYAAFALALVLGNIVLGQFLLRRGSKQSIAANLSYIYRAVQVGVVLVAAGTILGGLWADVSWGRFWGWDPKEVWALIVLLTYLALLHGRFAGWVKQFGLAAGAVVCFTAVLMSWYGVNFVLGVGLHSYGFGVGGQGYIASFILAEWLFVAVAWNRYRRTKLLPAAAAVQTPAVSPV
jgi:ABC-type transport system involved in cytochrome c biogenesis permease subunit